MKLNKFFLILIFLYLIIYAILPHTEYQPADPGIKILQVRDWIDSGFSTFSANYKARSLDETLNYFPTKPPFAYLIKNQAYYVFPYFLSILLSPFYYIGGIYLVEFLSLVSGILVIFLCIQIANEISILNPIKKYMIIFLSFGSINSIYSFMLSEAVHASLLISLSVFLVIKKDKHEKDWIYFMLAGMSSGISFMFRIELALFCALFFLALLLFKIHKSRSDVFFLMLGLLIPAILLIVSNYYITENILGLRGIEFLTYSGSTYPMKYRFINEIKALIGSNTALGLFSAWPVFLFLFPFFWFNKKLARTNELNFILFISAIFTILVPLIVKNADGSILGPRFAATVQPLLIVGTFKAIELLNQASKLMKLISKLKYIILYSISITILGYAVLFYFLKTSRNINLELDKKITGQLLILRNDELFSAVLPSYSKRLIMEIDSKEEIESFVLRQKDKLPNTLSMVSSKPKNDLEHPEINVIGFEIEDTFSKNGILIQNFRRIK